MVNPVVKILDDDLILVFQDGDWQVADVIDERELVFHFEPEFEIAVLARELEDDE